MLLFIAATKIDKHYINPEIQNFLSENHVGYRDKKKDWA